MVRRSSRLWLALATFAVFFAPWCPAQVSFQIVVDNDFAVFAGTSTSISRLVYQNDAEWGTQITLAANTTFALQPGETMLYILALGGGGDENLSGQINGVNLYDIYAQNASALGYSSNLSSFLTGFNSSQISSGTFLVSSADVQTALSQLTWGTPSLSTGTVVQSNPYAFSSVYGGRIGFNLASNEARLFRLSAQSVNLTAVVPEPATAALSFGLLGALLVAWHRRRAGA